MATNSDLRENSIADLLSGLSQESAALIREQLRLVVTDIAAEGRQVGTSVGLLGGAAALGVGAFGALTAALIAALGRKPARGGLMVAALYGAGAAGLADAGLKQLAQVAPQLLETVQRDVKATAKGSGPLPRRRHATRRRSGDAASRGAPRRRRASRRPRTRDASRAADGARRKAAAEAGAKRRLSRHGPPRYPSAVRSGAVLAALPCGASPEPATRAAATSRVDVSFNGARPEFGGVVSSLSAGGRLVAFSSSANNLTPDDTHAGAMGRDVFVRDRARATTTRVSVASNEAQGDDESDEPSISAGGHHVAFSSYASNFAAGDANGNSDVFVRDRRTGTTTLVSVASNGVQSNSFSGDPSISADGRFVAFESLASNLAAVRGFHSRVYVHDRRTASTTLITAVTARFARPVDLR